MKCIYIAGKLSDDAVHYLKNVSNMMEAAEKIRKMGFAVYVPALDLLMGIKFGWDEYNNYFNNSIEWLKRSDAVFLVKGWESSPGTQKEITVAKSKNIPIFTSYRKIFDDLK